MASTPVWTPLPKFGFGFAIYPFTPGAQTISSDSTKEKPQEDKEDKENIQDYHQEDPSEKPKETPAADASVSPDSASISSESSNSHIISYQVTLEVGDEVYVFEEQGDWYRGY